MNMGNGLNPYRGMFINVKHAAEFAEPIFMLIEKFPWIKNKGYLHLTPKIDALHNAKEIIHKVTNPDYVANYSFFPLIHSVIKERRYRVDPNKNHRRSHTKIKKGINVGNAKERPLHYATHMDALIFGYYAHVLYQKYEKKIEESGGLGECVLAYRKIKHHLEDRNKSTIDFAYDVFQEIYHRAYQKPVSVLKFDITSFFNHMDHRLILDSWVSLVGKDGRLPENHYNVFKAATQFSYILKNDLRAFQSKNGGRRPGLDEKKLATIRNKSGIHCLFGSNKEFREAIKSKRLPVYRYPFRKNGKIMGIPQGLPISAVLANMYLLKFDQAIKSLTDLSDGIYRRYSDDIIVICKLEDSDRIANEVREKIKEYRVEISTDKTETFIFKKQLSVDGDKVTSIKIEENERCRIGFPLTYLGFDFFGNRIGIKSANLAKFYRRMIKTVKRKCRYAIAVAEKKPGTKPIVYRRQLYRLYTIRSLSKMQLKTRSTRLIKNEKGEFTLKSIVFNRRSLSNYFSYVSKASEIMNEPRIKLQIRRHKTVLNQALHKYLKFPESK